MRWGIAAAMMGWAASAAAADKPVYAAPPAWVTPVAVPPVPAKDDGSAIQVLLLDQQAMLRPGETTVYTDSVFRLATPQALSAGNISLPWRPEFDTLTVHRLTIRRGTQVIDVLKAGQTFTVLRRETNLESATLDGVLTANIQPEGLQVGDVVEIAASLTSADPTLGSHVETVGAGWNGVAVEHAHLRVSWPSAMPIRWQATPLLGTPKPVRTGELIAVDMAADHLVPAVLPRGAPGRFQVGRLAEFTDYRSWADLAAAMAPLYAHAATIAPGSALAGELATLKALPTPEARAAGALALVQDRVRYVALAMGAGGLTPADAETTWARRFGDCKGKTALLLALLHGLGITADPVMVRGDGADGLNQQLPMVGLFDHVLVRAGIGGRTYWMDGTRRGDRDLASLRVPNAGWGLPVIAHDAALVRMVPTPFDRPQDELAIRLDLTDGIAMPAKVHAEQVLRGDVAILFSDGLAQLAPDARDRALREYWHGKIDFVTPDKVTATLDPKTGEERLALDGTGKTDWSEGGYETDGTLIGYHADFHRDAGPDRDAPFLVAYPYFSRTVETILLPPGFGGRDDGSQNVDETIAGIAYHRATKLSSGSFVVEKSERSVAPEFPFKDAAAAELRLRALGDKAVWLMRPATYRVTGKELDAALQTTPTTAAAFVTRGSALLDHGRFAEAASDFTHALALDPKDVWALADRGVSYAWMDKADLARADLTAAAAIEPQNYVMLRGRALLAERAGNPKEAVAAYSTAIALNPTDAFALSRRAHAFHSLGDNEHALADSAAVLKLVPANGDLRLLRANILLGQGKPDLAAAEMTAASAEAAPDDAWTHIAAGKMFAVLHRPGDSDAEFGRAIAIKDDAWTWVNRAESRDRSDVVHRRSDLDAALKLQPTLPAALGEKAELLRETGDAAGAVAKSGLGRQPGRQQPAVVARPRLRAGR